MYLDGPISTARAWGDKLGRNAAESLGCSHDAASREPAAMASRPRRPFVALPVVVISTASLLLFAVAFGPFGRPVAAASPDSDAVKLDQQLAEAIESNRHQQVVQLATKLIDLDDGRADYWYRRGRANFCLGNLDESLADFDQVISIRPDWNRRLWERGITCYYVGKYRQGADQFARYQKYDSNDVENAVWRFLCQARAEGVERARRDLLPVARDPRVPMTEIYRMFRGKLMPQEVVQRASADPQSAADLQRRLFYAHLYVGLYLDVTGQTRLAREHLELAVKRYPSPHYMHDVARIHLAHLNKRAEQAAGTGSETPEG